MEPDSRYAGTTIEVIYKDEPRLLGYEEFVASECKQFGRYEMVHRKALVLETDTLFMENCLVNDPKYQTVSVSSNGVRVATYCLVPVVDVLWARCRLEGLPVGDTVVLADIAQETEYVRGDAHSL